MLRPTPTSTLFPYTTLFRSTAQPLSLPATVVGMLEKPGDVDCYRFEARAGQELVFQVVAASIRSRLNAVLRSEEHTSELQSHSDLVCRLLLEKKNCIVVPSA